MNIGSVLSTIFKAIGGYFKDVFESVIGSDSAKSLETSIKNFITTDVGGLALESVEYVADSLQGASGTAARDAAKAKLVELAKAAGKDLEVLGQSALNLFIEMAYTALKAKLAA
jgi:hypothetical protein